MRKAISPLVAASFLLLAALAGAVAGDLDPTFSEDGKASLNGTSVVSIAVQPDGGILTLLDGGRYQGTLARFTATGRLDRGFGSKGIVEKPFASTAGYPAAVALQADGRIVIAGHLARQQAPFENDVAIARYLPDGSLDSSFSNDGVATLSAVGPEASAPSAAEESAQDLLVQADGKIVIAGYATDAALLARFNPDGSPDATFSGAGFLTTKFGLATTALRGIAAGVGDTIVAAGTGSSGTPPNFDLLVARVDAAGVPDPTFDGDGSTTLDFGAGEGGTDVLSQPDGKLVVGGGTATGVALARLNLNGTRDTSFGGDGLVVAAAGAPAAGIGLSADGLIYAASEDDDGLLALRFLANGDPDPQFSGDGVARISLGGAIAYAGSLAVQPDGRVLIGGGSVQTKDDSTADLARLRVDSAPADADGDKSLDATDECPGQFGPKRFDGCPLIKRKISLNKSDGRFRGQITAVGVNTDLVRFLQRDCAGAGKVTVLERRPGRDRKIGTTAAGLRWGLDRRVGGGVYYARLEPAFLRPIAFCGAAKSKPLRGQRSTAPAR